MVATGSRYTIQEWAVGLVAFVVFTIVALYVFLLTRPTGWTVVEWSLFLLCVVGTARIALAAPKRRRQSA
jgi:heme/copper-type cytochrome/quinol oxidase subunit 4